MRGAAEGTAAGHHALGATGAVAGGLIGTVKGLVEGAKAAKKQKPVMKAELEKAIPGTPKADAASASFHAAQAPGAAAPAPKLPTQAEHAQRASSFADHTPPGAFAAGAPSTAGLKSPMSAITAALHAPKPGAPVKGAVMPPGAGVSKQPAHVELMGKVKAALGSKPPRQ